MIGAQHCSSLCSQSEGHGHVAKNVWGCAAKAAQKSSPSLCEQSELQCWRRKKSINSNLRRPRCPKPRFQPSKIAKRLVRNCRAKKCCIFSLKCLDVNNLIHNFASQAKIGCTSAFLSPRANYKSFLKLPSCAYGNLLKHLTMKSFAHITPCTLCPSVKPVFACVEGTRFTPPTSVNELIFTFNSASPSCICVRRRIMS